MTISEIIYVNGTYVETSDGNSTAPSMGSTKVDLITAINNKITELTGAGKTVLSISIMPNKAEAFLVIGTTA
jgi:hypothetical protein